MMFLEGLPAPSALTSTVEYVGALWTLDVHSIPRRCFSNSVDLTVDWRYLLDQRNPQLRGTHFMVSPWTEGVC